MTTQEKNGITEGVIWKQLLIFFFPILVGSFFQQLYNTVDSVIVGQFVGKEALSSVGGSAGQIISLVVGFFTGVSTGATVIISQYFGAGKKRGDRRVSSHRLRICTCGRTCARNCRDRVCTADVTLDEHTGGTDRRIGTVRAGVFFRTDFYFHLQYGCCDFKGSRGFEKTIILSDRLQCGKYYIGSFTHSGYSIRRFRCGHCHPDRSGGQCCFGDSYTDVPHGGHETVSLTDPHVQKNAAEYFKNRSSGGI
ncbi:MATE efflux family protein [Roseburia inulinivorans DSM 16841]|uniref:MATE efflux family protein n=1 Tax=Roseburia inulinivorans DSM 16841 TaxID=622312 RepID=C0FSQ2_9FIRM|nr:MATE efflux family protein [Roseburia inulinivorans DSM 16841]